MSMRKCPKCGIAPCMCGIANSIWCPGKKQCVCTQHLNYNCAGPVIYTGEDNIGNRPCCSGLKKCMDNYGNQWCSHTGKCGNEMVPKKPVKIEKYKNIRKERYTSVDPSVERSRIYGIQAYGVL